MNQQTQSLSCEIPLTGLDGSNPLAFLAALGTLRSLSLAWPNRTIKMAWQERDGAWRPVLYFDQETSKDNLLHSLDKFLKTMKNHPAFSFDNNLKVKPSNYKLFLINVLQNFFNNNERIGVDFGASFGCEATSRESLIQDTAFRTMSGAGHQHFLKFMRDLVDLTDIYHLETALFELWTYQDSAPSMRWDPIDDRRYSLRWKNPSKDVIKTMRGANRLAIEGIPFYPTVPRNNNLYTTGFMGNRINNTFFTWPIWKPKLDMEVVRSVLSMSEIQKQNSSKISMRKMGINQLYCSQRITIGKYRNFTPSKSV